LAGKKDLGITVKLKMICAAVEIEGPKGKRKDLLCVPPNKKSPLS